MVAIPQASKFRRARRGLPVLPHVLLYVLPQTLLMVQQRQYQVLLPR